MSVKIIQSLPHVRTMVDNKAKTACHICEFCPVFETVNSKEVNDDTVAEFVARHRNCIPAGVRYSFKDLPTVTEIEV